LSDYPAGGPACGPAFVPRPSGALEKIPRAPASRGRGGFTMAERPLQTPPAVWRRGGACGGVVPENGFHGPTYGVFGRGVPGTSPRRRCPGLLVVVNGVRVAGVDLRGGTSGPRPGRSAARRPGGAELAGKHPSLPLLTRADDRRGRAKCWAKPGPPNFPSTSCK